MHSGEVSAKTLWGVVPGRKVRPTEFGWRAWEGWRWVVLVVACRAHPASPDQRSFKGVRNFHGRRLKERGILWQYET